MRKAGKLWGNVLKLMSILAVIGVFIAFMRMQEDMGFYDKLRNHGHVSQAVVEAKEIEEIQRRMAGTRRRTSGTTVSSEVRYVQFRFVPKSTVPFADYASGKVAQSALPAPPPVSADPAENAKWMGLTRVPVTTYDKVKPGDVLVVANVPWNPDSPVSVEEISGFTPNAYYYWLAGLSVLAVALWMFGRRVSRAG